MSNIKKNKAIILVALSVVSSLLISFTPKPGGEGFEIFLDNKLLLQRFNAEVDVVKSFSLDQSQSNAQLKIKYHHCGKIGKNRVVAIKDNRDKIIKEWHFNDATTAASTMTCSVKEILALKKTSQVLKLYYTSSELPKGRQLASIAVGSNLSAALTVQ